ncbi:MAG: PaaI family thioesterase [Sporomusaceae bacterium]|nr:PaaI family thioesterase [Sporomusaceae bacterium]
MSEQNTWCFACGKNNPIGLHLNFREENETYVSTFTPGPEHQSYDGVLHGGLVSTLLDEVMGGYLYSKGQKAVTAKLEVRFRAPTPIGRELTIRGKINGKKGSMYDMAATISLTDGTVTAEGKALIALVP